MSGINILSNNLTDNATYSLTTGTENAQFPLTNLSIDTTAKKFRSNENSVVVVVDLLQTSTIDTFAIVGDATGSFGASVVSIKTSVTTDFSLSTPIPITVSPEYNIGYEFITEVTHRYVEVTITGTGSYAEISKMFIGQRDNLPDMSISVGSFGYGHTDLSDISVNDYGQKFIDKRNKTKKLKGTFEYATKAETDTLDEIFLFHGTSSPLWVILDPDSEAMVNGKYKLSLYGYLDSVPQWTASGGQQYNAPISLSEVI